MKHYFCEKIIPMGIKYGHLETELFNLEKNLANTYTLIIMAADISIPLRLGTDSASDELVKIDLARTR